MLFSAATGYALQVLAVLPEGGEFTLAKDLSARLALPGPYLAKILQALAQGQLLESVRGPRGGFRLARPAEQITIGEVVAALEGPDAMEGCLMGLPECGHENPCPLHHVWSELKAQIDASLTRATLKDLQHLGGRLNPQAPVLPV